MPTTGAPGNIWYPDDTSPVAPLENLFLTQATSVNVALSGLFGPALTLNVADLNALPSAASYPEGRRIHVDALSVDFQVRDGSWVQDGVSTVANATARDLEYAKASGAYRVAGAQVRRVDKAWVEEWFATVAAPVGPPVSGWYPIFGNLPKASISATGFAITSTPTAYLFGTDVKRVDITRQASGLRIETAGCYQMTLTLESGTAGTAGIVGSIRRGSTTLVAGAVNQNSAADHNTLTLSCQADCAVNDIVAPWLSGTTNLAVGNGPHTFIVEYVGP